MRRLSLRRQRPVHGTCGPDAGPSETGGPWLGLKGEMVLNLSLSLSFCIFLKVDRMLITHLQRGC